MKSTLPFVLVAFLLAACATAPKPAITPPADPSIYVDAGGEGNRTPIVFIHGNGGSSEQWRAQLAHVRAGRHAIAVDLPGFGRSAAPPAGDYSLEAMAAAVDRAVSAARLDRFVLVGHSYGGAVVATYAAAHPEKVAGVVYLDAAATTLPLNDEQKEKLGAALRTDKMKVVRAWFAPMLNPSPEAVREAVLASVERTSTEAFIAALMSLTAYDAKSLVQAYSGPRVAIVASDVENPMSFQKQFPEVDVVAIPGAGHWPMLDKPDAVNDALDRFLASVR